MIPNQAPRIDRRALVCGVAGRDPSRAWRPAALRTAAGWRLRGTRQEVAITTLHLSTVERDLPLLVRLLLALRVTGRLQITQDRWMGAVYFAHGQIVAAALGAEQGLPALEALLLALPDGRYTFHEGVPAPASNIELAVPAL